MNLVEAIRRLVHRLGHAEGVYGTVEERLDDMTTGGVSGTSPVDHGTLTGLTDDDHTQYARKDTLTAKGSIYGASGASVPAETTAGSDYNAVGWDSNNANGLGALKNIEFYEQSTAPDLTAEARGERTVFWHDTTTERLKLRVVTTASSAIDITSFTTQKNGNGSWATTATTLTGDLVGKSTESDKVWKDYGAANFGDNFVHRFKFTVTDSDVDSLSPNFGCGGWGLSNAMDTGENDDLLGPYLRTWRGASGADKDFKFALGAGQGPGQTQSPSGDSLSAATYSVGTAYWVKITRVSDSLTAKIYSDEYITVLDTLTLTLNVQNDIDYRYLFVGLTEGYFWAPTWMDILVENYLLTEYTWKTVLVHLDDGANTEILLADSTATEGVDWAALTASSVTNTPAGNIAATDVQAAINELDTEKVAIAGDTMTGQLIVTPATNVAALKANKDIKLLAGQKMIFDYDGG